MTYFAVVTSGYLLNLRDPVFSVWLEMSGVWIPPGRNDQDASVGENWSIGCGYDRKDVILVVGRELVLVLFSIQDYMFLLIRTHNDDDDEVELVFFHLWLIGKSLMLRILRLSDHLDLLVCEWCAS